MKEMRAKVEQVFHEVADLTTEARALYLSEASIDESTRQEVEQLVEADAAPTAQMSRDIGQIAQWTLDRFEPGRINCGPYQLTKLLGHGGMGAVYSAERVDGEVSQHVAVKLLRPGADDGFLRKRFLAERQILATLSHPNIARLLDAGRREDGEPFFVMERVDGKPIDSYSSNLGLRGKISLFLKVCAAVSYLHRNLVVHRDLKPANILVNAEGEPKLLDFGIAKLLDSRSLSNASSMRILTPDYASPEQVNSGTITTASDIYSLGAVLYKLLTGVSPHQVEGDSLSTIVSVISNNRIAPPSKLAPNVKGDLEVVLMKALRVEPADRYTSVDAFANDLRACLERRPVQARAGEVWYRVRKQLQRHWITAAAAAVVIVSLATGLYVANRARMLAERRFSDLKQLSHKVIDLDAAIRTLPGSIEARKRLVTASLEYLEGLSRESHRDLDLTQEIADGYWRMARIQGVNAEFNLGDQPSAEKSLAKADALIKTVLASRPHDRGATFRSALIAHDRMIIAGDERRASALVYAEQSANTLETFLRLDPRSSPVRLDGFLRPGNAWESERRGAATLFSNIALTYVNAHDFEEGARYARRAVEIAQPIPSAQEITAVGLSVLANSLRYQGDLQGALLTIREARRLSELTAYPNQTARVFNQYGPLLREGRILGERDAVNLDRPAEAVEVLQKALDLNEGAARQDPSDSTSRGRVGTTARELGDILRDRDPKRALAVYDLGIRRVGEMRSSLVARRDHAELLAKSSYALRHLHREAEAAVRIETAVSILRESKDYPADKIQLGGPVYSTLRARADHEADMGNPGKALEIYDELLRKTSSADPVANLQDATRISQIYLAMAELNRRLGRNQSAAELSSRRINLWRTWDTKLPDNSFVRRQLIAANKPVMSTVQLLSLNSARVPRY